MGESDGLDPTVLVRPPGLGFRRCANSDLESTLRLVGIAFRRVWATAFRRGVSVRRVLVKARDWWETDSGVARKAIVSEIDVAFIVNFISVLTLSCSLDCALDRACADIWFEKFVTIIDQSQGVVDGLFWCVAIIFRIARVSRQNVSSRPLRRQ